MKDDPTIQAIRDARHRISEKVGHDPRRLIEYLRHRQEKRLARNASEPASSPSKKDEETAA